MPTKPNPRQILTILLAFLLVATSGNAFGSLQDTQLAPQAPQINQETVVRVFYQDRDQLTALAARFDVWQVAQEDGYAILSVTDAQYREIISMGYQVVIDEKLTAQASQISSIPDFPCYRTVEETYASINSLNAQYPNLTAVTDIGNSWDKVTAGGPAGYDLYDLIITNESIAGPKPVFFLMSEIHAREYATAEIAIRFAEHLLQNYGVDPDITYFVDYHEVHIVPMTNPDGRKFAEGGDSWRKNTDNDDGCTYNYGVDLNRNYSFKWGCCGGSSGDCSDETYRGPSAGSEPETVAIQNLVLSLFPDQRGPGDTDPAPADATGLMITLHSAAGLVLWPWGWTYTNGPNASQLQTIGNKLAYYNGYTPQQSSDLYITDGTTDDWSYGVLGIASFTYEIAGTFFEPCGAFDSVDWPDNRDSLMYALRIPETPYMTGLGPDALNAASNPTMVAPGDPVQATATINDQHNGSQTITAAEYFVVPLHSPTPAGDPGTGTPMTAVDGNWNSSNEAVTASIDTTDLDTGAYLVAMRGKDLGNNWGPISTAYLFVSEPGVAPVLEGSVIDACTSEPLVAMVEAGTFSTTSGPDGLYSLTVMPDTYDVTVSKEGYGPATVENVELENYQTLELNFALQPLEPILEMDGESGAGGWTAQSPWYLDTAQSHSPTHSWSDSPSNYGDNLNISLTSPVIDLTGKTGTTLSFWHKYAFESGWDYGNVQYTINGSTWNTVQSYTGNQSTWQQVEIAIPEADEQSNVRIRFNITTDTNTTYDGWHIDDIVLIASGGGCAVAPVANFQYSPSTIYAGDTVQFTDLSTGSTPMTYDWDFGDSGTSNVQNPTHTFTTPGTYTVTEVVSNSAGDSTATQVLDVLPEAIDVSAVTVTLETVGSLLPGQDLEFSVEILPVDATLPVNYSIEFHDGTDVIISSTTTLNFTFSHAFADPGEYAVVVKAWNNEMDPAEAVAGAVDLIILTVFKLFLPYIQK